MILLIKNSKSQQNIFNLNRIYPFNYEHIVYIIFLVQTINIFLKNQRNLMPMLDS